MELTLEQRLEILEDDFCDLHNRQNDFDNTLKKIPYNSNISVQIKELVPIVPGMLLFNGCGQLIGIWDGEKVMREGYFDGSDESL